MLNYFFGAKIIKEFVEDECGQGALEYILLFSAVIIIAIASIIISNHYYYSNSTTTASNNMDIFTNNTQYMDA
ncbi:MAG: class III signal peptide-containing protein [Methanobacterium sp.]